MKRSIGILALLVGFALAGSGLAQTASQYIAAGKQLYGTKDYGKAAQYYEAAAKLDPNSSAAYQGLGNCRYYQGDKAGALNAYDKALALDPGNTSLASFTQTLRAQVGTTAPVLPLSSSESPASSSVVAPAAPSSNPSKASAFELDAMAGVALGLTAGSGIGFGGGVRGLVPLGPDGMKLGGSLCAYLYSGITIFEVLGAVKYAFQMPGNIKPYGLGGLGFSFAMASGSSSFDPTVQIGMGASMQAGPGLDLFAEIKPSLIISGGTFTYIPVNAGLQF